MALSLISELDLHVSRAQQQLKRQLTDSVPPLNALFAPIAPLAERPTEKKQPADRWLAVMHRPPQSRS